MHRAALCAALAVAFAPLSAGAQSLMLTESDALARLSPDSPRVRAVRSEVELAHVDVLAAGRWPNPRVNWDRQSVAAVTEHYFTVSQTLPITGRRGLDVSARTALAAASSSRADDEVRRLQSDLRLAFAELVAAQTREQELVRAAARLRELSDVLARREQEGDAAGFDRLRAEREALDIDADLVVARSERASAQARLAGFFGERVDPFEIRAVGRSGRVEAVPPLDALLERAEIARGELVAFGHEVEAARLSARAAERSLVPEPELFLGTKSSTAASGGVGSAVTIGEAAVGPVVALHATIPLFDRARPERALAVARSVQAESRAAAFRAVLRGQVAALRDAVVQRGAAAERYRKEAVARAVQIEQIAQVSYDAGERGILELLDAHRTRATAGIRQAELDFAVRQAEIELAFASGWELP
jgi:cobalt-zinc-cadmium efflux system outer membrane protein